MFDVFDFDLDDVHGVFGNGGGVALLGAEDVDFDLEGDFLDFADDGFVVDFVGDEDFGFLGLFLVEGGEDGVDLGH